MFGNAEDVANDLNDMAKEQGFNTNIYEMNDVTLEDFQNMDQVAVVTSTCGHGDFPTNGEDFWLALEKSDLKLQNMKYGVCALGDSSHDDFCGAGKKIDRKLDQLGANRILDIQLCDCGTDGSQEWSELFLSIFKNR
tara:strand:- start:39095 stop:39505 length:411 start_codon:yes stop_codon:yes gene_type:complete